MDAWGTLDLSSAIARDDLNSSFRRSKKIVSTLTFPAETRVILRI